jgi:hypothetical protein
MNVSVQSEWQNALSARYVPDLAANSIYRRWDTPGTRQVAAMVNLSVEEPDRLMSALPGAVGALAGS